MKLIDDARDWWRLWSVRIQMLLASLGVLQWIDPGALIYAFNAMPRPVRDLLPESVFRATGLIVFAVAMLGIWSRMTRQKKLDERRAKRG